MKQPSNSAVLAALLSFNGGFVDAAGFFGLQGLFVDPCHRKLRHPGRRAGPRQPRHHRQDPRAARVHSRGRAGADARQRHAGAAMAVAAWFCCSPRWRC